MALQSMTGYGRGEVRLQGAQASAELRSVNRRQLDIQVSLPRALGSLEPRVLDLIRASVSRGRLHGDVWFRPAPDRTGGSRVVVDETAVEAYVNALRRTGKKLGLTDDLGLSHLAALPDVVRIPPPDLDPEASWPVVEKALRKALRALVAMRRAEGSAMQEDLLGRLDTMETHVQAIAERAPGVGARYRKTLLARLEAAELPLPLNDERLLREVAVFADRADISEEITRLHSHFAQARTLIRSRAHAGKPLDFLAQEMFREINTIGSKANDSRIALRVVQSKTELERIREQVQNIE